MSFDADLSDLTPLSNYDVFYSVGVSPLTTEILDWTQLTAPQSVNQVDLTISMVIPEDYAIYVNLKTVEKSSNLTALYNSSALLGN